MGNYIVVHSIKVATDFIPETFGRLTTVGPRFRLPLGSRGQYAAYQVCQCVCGSSVVIRTTHLKCGKSTSCNCYRKEHCTTMATTHGKSNTPEYAIWLGMKYRCSPDSGYSGRNYGGRGITVCDRWLCPENGFTNFLADMGLRPEGAYSIERKEVNGNYYPENCCWATVEEQARNRRNNYKVTYNGKTQCLFVWAREVGLKPKTLHYRLKYAGWSVEKALTTPVTTFKEE